MKKYDAIVIGTGQAGPALAARLAGAGHKTAVIEHGRFGGTCVNYGCTPTKAMVASAKAAAIVRRAGEFGVSVGGDVRVDMARVRKRRDEIVAKSRTGLEEWLTATEHLDVYREHGRFKSPRVVRAGNELLQAERIFVNVGTRPRRPGISGLDAVGYLTNESMLELDSVPEHLVIVGGSYVGLEFGQMFRRFGSEVTIVEKADRLVRREDEDVASAVEDILRAEGITIRLGADCISASPHGKGVRVELDCSRHDAREVSGTHLLLAVGRQPNTDDLGLDAAGVSTDDNGFILVDDRLETNVKGVYALGDVNGRGAFTHTSYNDGEIVASNLLEGGDRRVTDRILTYALYIDPPLARVGMTEAQARASQRPVLIARREMTRVSRAVEKGETEGFMKLLVDAETRKILGAAILGVGGDEVVSGITNAMYAGMSSDAIQRSVHIHPTVSELIPTALAALEPLE